MPALLVNIEAVRQNAARMKELAMLYGFEWLPVLKQVASDDAFRRIVKKAGISGVGVADVLAGRDPENDVLINIPPARLATEAVKRFRRAAVSSVENLEILEAAAKKAGRVFDVVLMVDAGDGREGIPLDEDPEALLRAWHARKAQNIRIVGVGLTFGCLSGLAPDDDVVGRVLEKLPQWLPYMDLTSGEAPVISMGGTVVWNWLQNDPKRFAMPAPWKLELRMGDPLLVGFDMYRGGPLVKCTETKACFRTDVFVVEADVLEVRRKKPFEAGTHVGTGHGASCAASHRERLQAIVDCGRLHTVVDGLELLLPGAELIDFAGNYAMLDIGGMEEPLKVGDVVRFKPDYWAVGTMMRSTTVPKVFVTELPVELPEPN